MVFPILCAFPIPFLSFLRGTPWRYEGLLLSLFLDSDLLTLGFKVCLYFPLDFKGRGKRGTRQGKGKFWLTILNPAEIMRSEIL